MPNVTIHCFANDCVHNVNDICQAEMLSIKGDKGYFGWKKNLECLTWQETKVSKKLRIENELKSSRIIIIDAQREIEKQTQLLNYGKEMEKYWINAKADMDEQEPAEDQLPGRTVPAAPV